MDKTEFVLILKCVIPADDRGEAEDIAGKVERAGRREGCHSFMVEVDDPRA